MSESSFVMEDNWRQRKSLMLIRKRAYLENCVSPAQMLLRHLFKPPVYVPSFSPNLLGLLRQHSNRGGSRISHVGRGRQHKLRAAPVYHLNFPENCMKMKKIGLMEGGRASKIVLCGLTIGQ